MNSTYIQLYSKPFPRLQRSLHFPLLILFVYGFLIATLQRFPQQKSTGHCPVLYY